MLPVNRVADADRVGEPCRRDSATRNCLYGESGCVILLAAGTGRVAIFSIDLHPALIMGHGYFDLFLRGVSAAVGAGDGNRIDASIAGAFPLRSK